MKKKALKENNILIVWSRGENKIFYFHLFSKMSLMNYMFTIGDYGLEATLKSMALTDNNESTNRSQTAPAEQNESYFKNVKKMWHYVSVEPLLICWLLPSLLFFIGAENLSLEKVCIFFLIIFAKFVFLTITTFAVLSCQFWIR